MKPRREERNRARELAKESLASARDAVTAGGLNFSMQFLSDIPHMCYIYSHKPDTPASGEAFGASAETGKKIFLFGFAVTH